MRKLQRHVPLVLTLGWLSSGITAVVFFVVGIWTPVWSNGWDCGDHEKCFQYQGDGRWFHMAWLFVAVAVLCGIGRVVMWQIEEEENHGH